MLVQLGEQKKNQSINFCSSAVRISLKFMENVASSSLVLLPFAALSVSSKQAGAAVVAAAAAFQPIVGGRRAGPNENQ